ncbi:MAG: PHP-associated domain-containing protein [Desulfatiglandales bacterium]
MRLYKADLHIHSCLSPCGELDMSPRGIVERGMAIGLDLISVCDHNSAENVGAVMRAGSSRGLPVLAGLEINSLEEVHSLALFDREEQALSMQAFVYEHLKGTNRPEFFGDQVVANEYDEVEDFNDRLLIGATQIPLKEIIREVHRLGGVSIASHVDRPSFSVLSQLGFIPADLELDALEISSRMKREGIGKALPETEGFPIVTFSDAHFLGEIGKASTLFQMERPNIGEIRLALAGESGRGIVVDKGL